MEKRALGNTGIELPKVSFGASSLGQEFFRIELDEAIRTVRTAIDCGMNYLDTSPFYGRGMSEVLLGFALRDVPRDDYLLCSKLGRYSKEHFDFSAKRVVESVDVSLERLGVDYLDVCLVHDPEFVETSQVWEETLPALRKVQEQGKVKFVGLSGYPMKNFTDVLAHADLDVMMTYNHYTLQSQKAEELIPLAQERGVGLMNAAPFAARMLTNLPLPPWHKATELVRATTKKASEACAARGVDIAQLAVQFSCANPAFATCVVGSAKCAEVEQVAKWAELPIDEELLAEVLQILEPIHNWHYIEGRPENNDPDCDPDA
ncbi:MAG: aldo/keto reductase [Candidatus Hydrogenedentota bacterium]